jgi:hypothetical protein
MAGFLFMAANGNAGHRITVAGINFDVANLEAGS